MPTFSIPHALACNLTRSGTCTTPADPLHAWRHCSESNRTWLIRREGGLHGARRDSMVAAMDA